jgi:hypothetical protein
MLTKKRLFLVLAILSLASIIYLIYSASQKTPPASSQLPVAFTPPQVTQVTFSPSLVFPTPSSQLTIYTATNQSSNYLTVLRETAQRLSLTPLNPQLNIWTNPDKTYYLSPEQPSVSFSYKADSSKLPNLTSNSTPPQLAPAIRTAQTLVDQLFSPFTLQPQPQFVRYLSFSGGHFDISNSNSYSLIEIPFSVLVDSFPFHIDSQTNPFITVTIGPNNQLVQFIVTPQSTPQLIKKSQSQPYSLDQVKNFVNQGNYQLIRFSDPYSFMDIPTTIESVNITFIALEYRFNSNLNLVMPYYLLSGTTDSTSPPTSITLTLPAVPAN